MRNHTVRHICVKGDFQKTGHFVNGKQREEEDGVKGGELSMRKRFLVSEESCEGKRKIYFGVRYGLCNARTIVQSMLQYEYVEAESYPQHEVGDYIMFL